MLAGREDDWTQTEDKTMKTLKQSTFAMEVEGITAKQVGGIMLPAGTVMRRETHIGFHPLDGVPVYRIEATLEGSRWRVFHVDGVPKTAGAH